MHFEIGGGIAFDNDDLPRWMASETSAAVTGGRSKRSAQVEFSKSSADLLFICSDALKCDCIQCMRSNKEMFIVAAPSDRMVGGSCLWSPMNT